MANTKTLTAANAIITFAIPGLFPSPQQLKGFATDNVYETNAQQITETAMGVDGRLSAGYVKNPIDQVFVLQADSDSNFIFEEWAAQQRDKVDAYFANGQTTLPAVQRTYVSVRGFLVDMPALPAAAKILQPRRYTVRWESIQSNPKG